MVNGNQLKQIKMNKAKCKGMVIRKPKILGQTNPHNPHCGSKSDGPFLDKLVCTFRSMQRVALGPLFGPFLGAWSLVAGLSQVFPFVAFFFKKWRTFMNVSV